jgi:hypothetical protein
MNMKQLEALLNHIKSSHEQAYQSHETNLTWDDIAQIERAIKYCHSRQLSAKRRSAHFKFLADEQREMLR